MLRRLAAVPLLLLWSSAILSGAPDEPSKVAAAPRFASRTELVLVPVVVHDADGKPIAGLKKDDFVVKENGQEQAITVFEEIVSRPASAPVRVARAAPAAGPQREFSNQKVTPDRPLVILVIDRINTPGFNQAQAREQVLQFLGKNVRPDMLMSLALVDRNGFHIMRGFTTASEMLAQDIRKLYSRPSDADQVTSMVDDPLYRAALSGAPIDVGALFALQSFEQKNAVEITLDAMQQMARTFTGVPGRKSVVWLTAGFPFQISNPQDFQNTRTNYAQAGLPDVIARYERTWQALADANVALYPVDVRGLTNSDVINANVSGPAAFGRRGSGIIDRQSFQLRDTLATMRTFADATGGRPYFNHNDLALGVERAVNDSSAYYMLGYYLPRDAKPGWHKLSVKVKGAGEVRARSGFFVTREGLASDSARKADIALALSSPLDFTAIPITLTWSDLAPAESGERACPYEIVLPANAVLIDAADRNHMSLQVVMVARKRLAEGAESRQAAAQLEQRVEARLIDPAKLAQVRDNGITYRNTIKLAPGRYAVRFVVRDNLSGRTGSLTAPLEVR